MEIVSLHAITIFVAPNCIPRYPTYRLKNFRRSESIHRRKISRSNLSNADNAEPVYILRKKYSRARERVIEALNSSNVIQAIVE